eukprot:gene22899-2874_t
MSAPALPPPALVTVLYDDEWYVVVDKPAGICVHRSAEIPKEYTDFVVDRAAAAAGCKKLWPVHRLDRPTSGVLVFARTSAACAALQLHWNDEHDAEAQQPEQRTCSGGGGGGTTLPSGQRRRRNVVKQYIGCVYGCVSEEPITCSKPLTKHTTMKEQRQRKAARAASQPTGVVGVVCDDVDVLSRHVYAAKDDESVAGGGGQGVQHSAKKKETQECSTVVSREAVLWMHEGTNRASLVRCELHTGRRHQIRRHLAHL